MHTKESTTLVQVTQLHGGSFLDHAARAGTNPEEMHTPCDRSTPSWQPLESPIASTKPVEILRPKAVLEQQYLLPVPRETHPWAFLSVFPKVGCSCVLSHKTVNRGLGLTSCGVSHSGVRLHVGEFWPLLLDFQIEVVVYEIIDLLGHPTLFRDLALDP